MWIVAWRICPDIMKLVSSFINVPENGRMIAMRKWAGVPKEASDEAIKAAFQVKFLECAPEPILSSCTASIAVPVENGRKFMDIDTLTWEQKYTHMVQVTSGLRDEYGRPVRGESMMNVYYSPKSDSWKVDKMDCLMCQPIELSPTRVFDMWASIEKSREVSIVWQDCYKDMHQNMQAHKHKAQMKELMLMRASLQQAIDWQDLQRKHCRQQMKQQYNRQRGRNRNRHRNRNCNHHRNGPRNHPRRRLCN